ncbi:MAG: EamA family transporter [Vicinamibacteria bacterium]|nr:EamA family transporter [Vicinamibacteria bacterium]
MTAVPSARPSDVPAGKTVGLTLLALVCFALNSLLCRAALRSGLIDASSFTLARLASGALVLFVLVRTSGGARNPVAPSKRDRALSALALFMYALPFSLAYLRISAGTGAFLVFGCVQITMIGSDLLWGRRIQGREAAGLALALFGLGWLTRPGAESPDPLGALLMAISGFAWGIYSIRGRTSGPALFATARNFAAALPLSLGASLLTLSSLQLSVPGLLLAMASGGITSGLGYVAWYAAVPSLTATRASIVQLAVPPLASALGILFLGEVLTLRLLVAAPLILCGIAIAVAGPKGLPSSPVGNLTTFRGGSSGPGSPRPVGRRWPGPR